MSFRSTVHLERGTDSSSLVHSSSAVPLCRTLWMPNQALQATGMSPAALSADSRLFRVVRLPAPELGR